jgi:hypothetical protein
MQSCFLLILNPKRRWILIATDLKGRLILSKSIGRYFSIIVYNLPIPLMIEYKKSFVKALLFTNGWASRRISFSFFFFFKKNRKLKPRLLHRDNAHGLLLKRLIYLVLQLNHSLQLIQESTSETNRT